MKIHVVAVNVKTKKMLAMKVTDDERVHDSKAFSKLVNGVMKSDKNIVVGKIIDDGAYDGNDIFGYLSDNEIQSYIKVRKTLKSFL